MIAFMLLQESIIFINVSTLLGHMPREQIRMPSSSAGVLSFYDEEESSIKLKPQHVIILCVIVALGLMWLNYW